MNKLTKKLTIDKNESTNRNKIGELKRWDEINEMSMLLCAQSVDFFLMLSAELEKSNGKWIILSFTVLHY